MLQRKEAMLTTLDFMPFTHFALNTSSYRRSMRVQLHRYRSQIEIGL